MENKWLSNSQFQRDVYVTSILQGISQKKERSIVKSQRWVQTLWNSVFWTWTHNTCGFLHRTCKLSRQSTLMRGIIKSLLNWELLTVQSFKEEKGHFFFSRVWPLIGFPYYSVWFCSMGIWTVLIGFGAYKVKKEVDMYQGKVCRDGVYDNFNRANGCFVPAT